MFSKTFWIILFLFVMLSLSLFSILYVSTYHQHNTGTKRTLDAFMQNATYQVYTKKGKLNAQLKSTTMLHYKERNSSYFVDPTAILYTKERIPWHVNAKNGIGQDSSNWIYLWDHVMIHQPKTATQEDTKILSSAAIIHPKQETAESDRPVTIVQPDTQLHGMGVHVDFKNSLFDFKEQPKGHYRPKE